MVIPSKDNIRINLLCEGSLFGLFARHFKIGESHSRDRNIGENFASFFFVISFTINFRFVTESFGFDWFEVIRVHHLST